MKVSEFSVKHPIIISMILLVLVAFGFYSLSGMRTEFMEDISMPQAIVSQFIRVQVQKMLKATLQEFWKIPL